MRIFTLYRTSLLAIVLTAFAFSVTKAQDIHFSQFYMSNLTLNPAAAGAFKDVDVTANYRSQWGSITTNPYKTMAVAGDFRLHNKWKKGIIALGFNVFQDQAGDGNLSTLQANLSLACHIKLDLHSMISAGLNGAFGQKSINYNNLTWDNQYVNGAFNAQNPSLEPTRGNSFFYPDFGAGVMYQYNRSEMYISGNDKLHFDLGFSVAHFNQPSISFANTANELLYMRYAMIANVLIGIKNTPLSIVPGMVFYRQGPTQEIQAGSMLKYTLKEHSKYTGFISSAALNVGAYYRWDDALVVTGLIELSSYSIGLSYDANLSKLLPATTARGGFEIALRYTNASGYLYQHSHGF